ncbi:MAG: NAD-dependent epimerase/dehydratase family protein [Proteobacteria bacterium]|nr:NAD-dependent epimerase/dehydratase family protein [Pseudomonadota bacterium]
MSRRALVTGATGGLGLALVRALRAGGYAVRATGRDAQVQAALEAEGAEVALADLTEGPQTVARLCQGMDVVFHAAALSSPWGPEAEFQRINVQATHDLLAAARSAGCEGLVFVSSPSVYARLRDQTDLTEDDPPAPRPMNAYARSKLAGERAVLTANQPGFFTTAIRPRALVGPDDRVLLPRLLQVLRRGRFPAPRGGRALIELTDVRDAARALVLADQRRDQAAGQVFNISGGRPLSVAVLAARLGEAIGRDIRQVSAPWPVMWAAASLVEGLARAAPGRPEPPVTAYGVATLAFSQTFDLSLAREVLGYAPNFDANATAVEMARIWAAQGVGR